jgi:MoaA/NifB/PqqE/SkfB family radical SAM enzyme/SAM-dependent methyltransferase
MRLSGFLQELALNAKHFYKIKKPLVWVRYFRKLLTYKLHGKITPRQIDIALTFKCNLQCSHCFATPLFRSNGEEMSYEVLQKLAEDCLLLDIPVIHFTGGENLLREDLEQVIRVFKVKSNIIYVQSNGVLASPERLRSLRKAGLDFFSVSLESDDEVIQNQFRHYPGYFQKALGALAEAQKVGLQTSVNLTIDKILINSPQLPGLIEMLGKLGHIVYANLPVPVGRYRTRKDLLWLEKERLILRKLTLKYPHFRTEFDSNLGPYGCPAMKEKIYLCAYGDVIPCPYIHVSFGNVKDESLIKIRERGLEFDLFRNYYDHCLAAENELFIDKLVTNLDSYSLQPVPYHNVSAQLHELGETIPVNYFKEKTMSNLKNNSITMVDSPCKLCGSTLKKNVISARDYETDCDMIFNVVQCPNCDLVYTSPHPSMEDLFKYFYREDYVCYQSGGVATHLREEFLCKSRLKNLKGMLPSKARFLDVGCSYGYFIGYLKRNTDWDVYGCEPDQKAADLARSQGLQVTVSTLEEAGYPSNYFDMVYMSHVLEHVLEPLKAVQEVYRILRPGGILLTENPDFGSKTRPFFGPYWWGYHLPRHLTHFTHKAMTDMLTRSGFQVERIKPCLRPGPIAWSFQNMLKDKGYSSLIWKTFGLNNPFFLALLMLPAMALMKTGHGEMMETLAHKPAEGKE